MARANRKDSVPITAKLSRAFYERLGDDVANELVDWFNQVDLAYRSELRELNELNFARFDAKVGERLAELRSELIAVMDARIKGLDARFGSIDARFGSIDARFSTIDARFADLQLDLERRTQSLRTDMERQKYLLLRWMFAFWVTTLLGILGLYLRP